LNGGFLNVPTESSDLFPKAKGAKIRAIFDEGDTRELGFNPDEIRITGLTKWYRRIGAKIDDHVIIVKTDDETYTFTWKPSDYIIPEDALPAEPGKKRLERETYQHIRKAFMKYINRKSLVLEITASGGRPPEKLEKFVTPSAAPLLSNKTLAPDLFGGIVEQESSFGFGILKEPRPNCIVIEVKDKDVTIGDFYQAKRYGEVFNAKYAFLVSTAPLPSSIRKFFVGRSDITRYRSSVGERFVTFAVVDLAAEKLEFPRFTDPN
jgi:hypothetical protein